MITKLTTDQEARFPEFVDKWLKIGLSTQRINRPIAIKSLIDFQLRILRKRKVAPIMFLNGPLDAWIAVLIFSQDQVGNQVKSQVKNQVWNQVKSQVGNQVGNQVKNQVKSQVGNQVGNQVKNQVKNQVENQVGNQVGNQVWNQVKNQVWNQVGNQVKNQVGNQVKNQVENQVENFVWPYWSGQFWAGYFAFFDTLENFGLKYHEAFYVLKECVSFGPVWPLDNLCIVSERPTSIQMRNGLLHKDGAPAVEYADRTMVFALNGVRMPADLVLTRAEEIEPKRVLTEANAEVRREALRKIGIERFLSVAKHKVLERKGNYELLTINLSKEIPDARYLKMLNPSIGCWHVEGVHPDCDTVQHAINWRASQNTNKEWVPDVLT